MHECDIQYIPKRLHWENKELITGLFLNEKLFWRVPKAQKVSAPPYKYFDCTLSNISVNRLGDPNNPICVKEDVLYSIDIEEDVEKYEDKDIVILNIPRVDLFPFTANEGGHNLLVELLHDPLNCNYPHTIIKFKLDNIEVTYDNRKDTLHSERGALKKPCKILRKTARDFLHKLVVADSKLN